MWHWQHKNIHKRHLLWLKFFSVCLFAHLTFLSWVFFIDHDPSHTISVSLNKHMDYSAPILFVPLHSQKTIVNSPTQRTTVVATKKITTPSKPTPIAQPVKKTSTPATTLTVAKPAPVKKVTPAQTAPTKTTPQTPATKTIENKPVIAPATKEVAKKTEAEQQKTTPEKADPLVAETIDPAPLQKATEQPTIQQPTDSTPPSFAKATEGRQRIIPENAHISDDYREVEAMRRTALLQKELLNNWKPPVGMPASAGCEISFMVDTNGSVKSTAMVKSSGIVMYDLSARHALFAMKMPQWTHGKTLTINFKQ